MRCLGYKKVNFTAQDTKTEISGYRCTFIGEYLDDEKAVGFFAETPFVSEEKFKKFKIDELCSKNLEFVILYNKYGKIQEIRSN